MNYLLKSLLFFLLIGYNSSHEALSQSRPQNKVYQSFDQNSRNDISKLYGEWEYYPFSLLKPGNRFIANETVTLPHIWSSSGPAEGFATYRTTLSIPPTVNKKLALYMPDVYNAYNIWIDGEQYKGNGIVSDELTKAKPFWLPQVIEFSPKSDTIEIIIQVSNFHHYRGGIGKVMTLGEEQVIKASVGRTRRLDIILFVILNVIAILSLILNVRYKHFSLLFFSFLAISWSFRSIFSNDYLAVQQAPELAWIWVVRIEYITIYLSALLGLLFVSSLFPQDFGVGFKRIYILLSLLFTAFTLFSTPLYFTAYVHVYLGYSASLLIAIFFVLTKAFINERYGSNYLMGIILLGTPLFAYVILAYEKVVVFNEYVFNIGFILLFILAFGAVWYHLEVLRQNNKVQA
jgi:hypothetical protein